MKNSVFMQTSQITHTKLNIFLLGGTFITRPTFHQMNEIKLQVSLQNYCATPLKQN